MLKEIGLYFFNLPDYKKNFIESALAAFFHFILIFCFSVKVWAFFIISMLFIQGLFVFFRHFNLSNKIMSKLEEWRKE